MVDHDDESSDFSDTESIDSCEEFLNFESIRTDGHLEEAISFQWPGITRKITISTLLEEDDLAPLFDGSRWAGTRLWAAAVRAVQYLTGHLPGTEDRLLAQSAKNYDDDGGKKPASILELGCGLGVPGMIFHLLGCNVVLTDQAEILSQLQKNVVNNFPSTTEESADDGKKKKQQPTIQAMPLSWSRTAVNDLLTQLGKSTVGFDIVVNCDCVYEPLYGKSWHLLNETIDELLKVNPETLIISSMERRQADGINLFLEEMSSMQHVGLVEKVWAEEGRKIEIYITRGIS